jgi:hypothetical protein
VSAVSFSIPLVWTELDSISGFRTLGHSFLATHALDKAHDALEAGPDDEYKSSKKACISSTHIHRALSTHLSTTYTNITTMKLVSLFATVLSLGSFVAADNYANFFNGTSLPDLY